jgi:hypothetical protein
MNKLIVWFQRQMGLADGTKNFCEGHRKKLMLLAIAGSRCEIGWFGVNFWPKCHPRYHWKALVKGFQLI